MDFPFWGSIAMKMQLVERPEVGTAAIDGKHIFYNPEWIVKLNHDEAVYLMAHEAGHVLLGHHIRLGHREHDYFNAAGDMAINFLLDEAGLKRPECGGCFDELHRGLATEEYYNEIYGKKEDEPEEQNAPENDEGDDTGNDEGEQDGDGPGDENEDDTNETGDGSGEGDEDENDEGQDGDGSGEGDEGQDGQGNGQGNSGNEDGEGTGEGQGEGTEGGDTKGLPNDNASDNSKSFSDFGGVIDSPEPDPAKSEVELKQIAIQAKLVQEKFGSMGAGLGRAVQDILSPPPSVDDLLRDWFDTNVHDDWSMTKLHKRTFFSNDIDVLHPGLHNEDMGTLVFVFDTSMSVTDEILRTFAMKLNQFREQYNFDSIVLDCDTKIYNKFEFSRDEEIDLSGLEGGGGTDFRPPFEYVRNELSDEITGLIYFTDLYGTFPDIDPPYPVLWSVYGPCQNKAPFGDTVKLEL